MSVDPWMEACPRSARMPPPGRPILPSSACRIDAVRMYCTPTVCWVHPTLYTNAVVRLRPEFSVSHSQTRAKVSGGTPQACSTISGVYRAKCRLSTWNTQRGWVSVSSRSGAPGARAAPPDPWASPRPASRTAADPQRHVQVGQCAGAGEPRVDVEELRAARLRLHHPLEPDRMAFGHVRALDQDAISVLQVLLEGGRAAPAKARSQTGNGGGVSYPGLVLDLDRAQCGEQLLDQVVLFVVQRRPAEAGE